MKKVFAFILMAAMACGAQAQMQGMVKLSYGTKDPGQLITDLENVAQSPTVDFVKNCNASLGLRGTFPLGIYAQAEAVFSVNSAWEAVDTASANFIEVMANTFSNAQSLSLTIPVYVGWKIIGRSLDDPFTARVFAGPEFYTTLKDISTLDFNTYSLSGGLGIDLFNTISIDGKATWLMASKNTEFDKSLLYFSLSVGLYF